MMGFTRRLFAHKRFILPPVGAFIAFKTFSFDAYAKTSEEFDIDFRAATKPRGNACERQSAALQQELSRLANESKTEVVQKKDLPFISLDELRADHGEDVWVSWQGGVFKVTAFMDAHPGGSNRILMANGQDLKAFWGVYKIHNRPHIQALLQDYRIGNLTEEDQKIIEGSSAFGNYYQDQPERVESEMRVASHHPWNSEPKDLDVLVDNFYTPNHLFFVRNHNSVPEIDIEDWTLDIEANEAIGIKERSFTYDELKTLFKKYEVISALQCAGNRQEDFVTEDRPLYVAPHWRCGAIGCAKWGGVRVRDILEYCGLDVDAIALGKKVVPGARICNFMGTDEDETGVPYAGVLPMAKVLDPYGDVILAYEMNGEVLPPDHGFPVRCLAPGHAGCRNVKWVREIAVTAKPSEFDSGSKLDRHFAPDVAFKKHIIPEELNWEQGPVIQTLPVQSIICRPKMGQILPGDSDYIQIAGVAWSGAGRGVCRVEVSLDGGKNFTACNILPPPTTELDAEYGMGRNWAWRQWGQKLPIPDDIKERIKNNETVELDVCVRAVDGDFNTQPKTMEEVWNVLGICINHWHEIKIYLNPLLETGDPLPEPLNTPPPGQFKWKHDYERVDLNPGEEY